MHREIKKNLVTPNVGKLVTHVQTLNFRGQEEAGECLRAVSVVRRGTIENRGFDSHSLRHFYATALPCIQLFESTASPPKIYAMLRDSLLKAVVFHRGFGGGSQIAKEHAAESIKFIRAIVEEHMKLDIEPTWNASQRRLIRLDRSDPPLRKRVFVSRSASDLVVQRPRKFGVRFSRKAVHPSCASALSNTRLDIALS